MIDPRFTEQYDDSEICKDCGHELRDHNVDIYIIYHDVSEEYGYEPCCCTLCYKCCGSKSFVRIADKEKK